MNEQAIRHSNDPKAAINYPPFIRLEFRLHHLAATRCLHHAVKREPIPSTIPGIPPLPAPVPGDFGITDINAKTLFAMYRHLLCDFPDIPRRSIKRLTVPEIIAVGVQQQWQMHDGRSILDLYRTYVDPKAVRRAQKLSLEIDIGTPLFRWQEIVPADSWGPFALPTVAPPATGIRGRREEPHRRRPSRPPHRTMIPRNNFMSNNDNPDNAKHMSTKKRTSGEGR